MSGITNDDDLMEKGGIMETSEDASDLNNLPLRKTGELTHTTIVGALLPHILIQPRIFPLDDLLR
jgi:hypothetical protein